MNFPFQSVSQSEITRIPKLCEAETQTDPIQQLLKDEPMITSTPNGSPGAPYAKQSIDLDLSIRSDYSSKTPSDSRTPRLSSLNSYPLKSSPGVSCECPGCPGNPLTFPEGGYDEESSNIADIVAEHFSKISREYAPLQVESLPERVRLKIANPESE